MKATYLLGNIDLHNRGRKGNRVFVTFDDTSNCASLRVVMTLSFR